MLECDVLVVGAGPAGASAAYKSASSGIKTIVIDKKEKIGEPVQCAEAIGKYLIQYVPFGIPKEQLIWDIKGISFYYDELKITKIGDSWAGYSIDRRNFDKWLYNKAISAGAIGIKNCELIDLGFNDAGYANTASIKIGKEYDEIKFKILIACDGVFSTVREICNLKKEKIGAIAHVYSLEMKNLDIKDPKFEQVYVGEFTPSGYAYIFPKSKKIANIGIGGIFPKKKLEYYFYEFLEIPIVKKQMKNAEIIYDKSGYAPFAGYGDEILYKNILFAGDSANQNIKPFIEGILPGIICGYYAGEIAASAVKNKNLLILNEYIQKINNTIGQIFQETEPLIDVMINLFQMKNKKKYYLIFGLASNILKIDEINVLMNKKNYEIINIIKSRLKRGRAL